MMYDILYESCVWHTRVALFNPMGRLLTVHYDDVLRPFLENAVIIGRIRRIAQGLNAAFVDIGAAQDGFLPLNTIPAEFGPVTEGREIIVRITRAPVGEKGAKLSARVLNKRPEGEVRIPSVLQQAPTAISRTLMDAGDHPVRVWVVDGRFKPEVATYVNEQNIFCLDQHPDVNLLEELDTQLETAAGPTFTIPGGGRLTVEMTKALTSIDVDAASMADARGVTPLLINKRAAEEVFRLCRLQEMGGSILVDFITMSNKQDRKALEDYAAELATYDMADLELMPLSRSGMMEITRKRTGENLMVRLKWPMYVAGAILLTLWRNKRYVRPCTLEAHSTVIDILRDRLSYEQSLTYLGVPVELKVNDALAVDQYRLSTSAAA